MFMFDIALEPVKFKIVNAMLSAQYQHLLIDAIESP